MSSDGGDPAQTAVGTVWAVVLAGGASRRFGTDKLDALLDQETLLEHAIRDLPDGARVVLVGPPRPTLETRGRPIAYVREDPPGGGPAAGMIAGLKSVLDAGPSGPDDMIVVLPGDAPAAGRAAAVLREAFRSAPGALAAVGVDDAGREQPLQLVLRLAAARRLLDAAGPGAGHGASARALVTTLDPGLRRVTLPDDLHADIDTTADLERWRGDHSG
jgi:molybdopterin-guanine dinucleotide biosynthesis protein A